jgi:hypothetical protein
LPIPIPEPGLVIGYSYLWHHERNAGLEEGLKDRPCAIIVATLDGDGDTVVYVAPITHTAPSSSTDGLEIPTSLKRYLNLDDERSWVITSELNRFIWPGYDLRPVSRDEPDSFVYGFLSTDFFAAVKASIIRHRDKRSLDLIPRS